MKTPAQSIVGHVTLGEFGADILRHGRFVELGSDRQARRGRCDPNGAELLPRDGNDGGEDG
jgi:hypothetical protein